MKRPQHLAHATAVLAVSALAAPATAAAHGLTGSGASSVSDFLGLGFRHMLLGWDHLLFAAGVILLAGEPRRAAKLVSLFVLGHSTTLIVATLGGWTVNAAAVDVVIALSVAYVGHRLLRGRPSVWWPTGVAILCFGLAHGLGLATRLQGLDLPSGGSLVARIVAFNVGVELGQITAIAAIAAVAILLEPLWRPRAAVGRPAAAGLAVTGVIAAAVLGFDAVKPDEASATIVRDPTATCAERPASAAAPAAVQGGHPERSFYGVDVAPPERDLAHVLGDGYVVVRYRRNITRDQQRALEEWSGGQIGLIVAPASARAGPVVEARSAKLRFTCDAINVDRLAAFQERWLRARRADATR